MHHRVYSNDDHLDLSLSIPIYQYHSSFLQFAFTNWKDETMQLPGVPLVYESFLFTYISYILLNSYVVVENRRPLCLVETDVIVVYILDFKALHMLIFNFKTRSRQFDQNAHNFCIQRLSFVLLLTRFVLICIIVSKCII
jgi:hypothetical protein